MGEGFANLLDGRIGGVDWGLADAIVGAAETDGRVLEIEIDHAEITFEALGEILRDAADEEFIFAKTHGGDVGELIVFVDEGGVGVGGVAAAGEDVEQGDGVTRQEPVVYGDGERKRCVVAMRREDENLQVRLQGMLVRNVAAAMLQNTD
jgi:hypothetical protein